MKQITIFLIFLISCKNFLYAAEVSQPHFLYYSEMFSIVVKSIDNDFKKFKKNIKPAYVIRSYNQIDVFDYMLLLRKINNQKLPLSYKTQDKIVQGFISLKYHHNLNTLDQAKKVWNNICCKMQIYQISSDRVNNLLDKLYGEDVE